MSFYLRKAVSVGPFRFNLSKSGVGVSAGIRGLRIGSGPRGNYVHMGRGGLYYRKSLPAISNKEQGVQEPTHPARCDHPSPDVEMRAIDSGDVSRMTHSSSIELLEEINKKKKTIQLLPASIITGISAIAMAAFAGLSLWMLWVIAIIAIMLIVAARYWDVMTKSTVLLYEIENRLESEYSRLHAAADAISMSKGCWNIEASGAVSDRKYHAGASSLLERKMLRITRSLPPFMKSNVIPVAIPVGRQTLYLFPDRVLVFDSNKVGAVGYDQLSVQARESRFIESGSVPSDAAIVGNTWQYVNKKGGPDKRFANNRELPICQYEEIHFKSSTGLNELIQTSRVGVGLPLSSAISSLQRELELSLKTSKQLIRIAKNGEDLGEHTRSDVREMIFAGKLTDEDYYLDISNNEWTLLQSLKI